MTASALTPSLAAPSQATVTASLMAAKKAKGMSFADLEAALGLDEVWIASLFYGQATASACLLYTSPSPRDATLSRMPSSA